MKKQIDPMAYTDKMEILASNMLEDVNKMMNEFKNYEYTKEDIKAILEKDHLSPKDFGGLLSPVAGDFLEEMAEKATLETRKHFGNSINLFTPLYISNYCDNYCIYCGFNNHNAIQRVKLTEEGIRKEMAAIAKTGMEEILILTGESESMSDVKYIGAACAIAREYFKLVGVEVQPMNTEDYAYIHKCGADFVTVFQETYNPEKYGKLHLEGNKRSFPYRFYAQERALRGGMRGVGFAALLGLDDFRMDAFAVGMHAYLVQKKYPYAEIAFSCPRLRPIINNNKINPRDVHEKELLQIMMAYRLFLPFASMTISTREREEFRNNVIGLAATRISAGVNTGIGNHGENNSGGDEQFEISDHRSLEDVCEDIRKRGLQPVMNDYVFV